MSGGYAGLLDAGTAGGEGRSLEFIVQAILNRRAYATLVQVESVTPTEAPGPQLGVVSALPLVLQVDGLGNTFAHGIVPNLPYFRLQGGANAVICDPAIGDIGIAIFCDRDISGVKATRAPSPPGSRRRGDWADGIYIGAFPGLNVTPTQAIQFTATGISIFDVNGNTIAMEPGNVKINGLTIDQSGNLSTPGGVTGGAGGADQVGLQTHKHPTAATGAPSSPTPGT